MTNILKLIAASAAGILALGFTAASADHDRRYKPDYCAADHDHRSHAANYYDYYPEDRYYRSGPYDRSGVSLSVRFGDRDRYDDYGYDRRDRHYRGDRRYRDNRGRVVKRRVYDTRYRARIVLKESVVHGYRGRPRLVCTVSARGPEARYVSERRMYRIARNECSRRARIQVYS